MANITITVDNAKAEELVDDYYNRDGATLTAQQKIQLLKDVILSKLKQDFLTMRRDKKRIQDEASEVSEADTFAN